MRPSRGGGSSLPEHLGGTEQAEKTPPSQASPEVLQVELANPQDLLPGPASAELTTGNNIRQLHLHAIT